MTVNNDANVVIEKTPAKRIPGKISKVKQSYESYKYLDQYEDLLTLKLVPVSEILLDRLGTDLVKWAMGKGKAGPFKLNGFFFERGISRSTRHRWLEKSPRFKEQYELAKQIIGDRREEAAFFKKADAGIFLRSAANYDPEWLEADERRAQLSNVKDNKPDRYVITIPDANPEGGEEVVIWDRVKKE